MNRRVRTLVARAAVVAAIGGGLVVATGAPANAAGQDGSWNYGEFSFWYNSSAFGYGSLSDFLNPVSNLGSPIAYTFLSSGAGNGVAVKNHAAAGGNARNDGVTARVYYNSGYSCVVTCQNFNADSTAHDFNTTLKNNDASWKFI